MKKIGIMTMQRVINYGSFLQAYGLKKTIEELDKEIEVDFVDFANGEALIEKKKKNYFEKIKNNINIIKFYNKKKTEKNFRNAYNDFCYKYLKCSPEKNINAKIDELVVGSDEVFNCLQGAPIGYSKDLFGIGYKDIPKISYAGCFGFTTLEGLKKYKIDREIGNMLNEFKSISVRDENSFNIIKELTKHDPILHLDPVLISNYDKEIDINIEDNNYIILYAYTGRITRDEEKCIKKFAKKYNKKIISIGFYQKIADKTLIVNPFEVLSYFKNADYVITDTFHGSVFSIKTNAKFCTIIRESNRNKLGFLLKKLGQESRMVNSLDEIEKLYNIEMNYECTNKILKDEREKTINYLKENII